MKTRTLFFAAASMLSTGAFAAPCQPVYGPAAPLICDLFRGGDVTLAAGGSASNRILLPLNTTIKDSELPVYSVRFRTSLGGGFDAGRVHVSMTLTDDTGGYPVPLGNTEATVQPGLDDVSLAVGGRRFAQPGHLNVTIQRIDEGEEPLVISDIQVIQSFNTDIEALGL